MILKSEIARFTELSELSTKRPLKHIFLVTFQLDSIFGVESTAQFDTTSKWPRKAVM